MEVTLWGHRPISRCLAVFGVGSLSVGGSQVSLRYLGVERRYVRILVSVYSLSRGVRYGGTVIPRLTKIIRSGIIFFSQNLRQPKLLALSNVNNPVRLVCLPYVKWSAHFFVTHTQTEKISSWNGPTVHVCRLMLARASTKTFVSRVRKTVKKNLRQPKDSLAGPLVS